MEPEELPNEKVNRRMAILFWTLSVCAFMIIFQLANLMVPELFPPSSIAQSI
ncbi:MAG: hypothetical protein UX49_C0021G0005 [Candidatus Wolfebacteria bacterium GW2011_GWC2_46_275]|nr:MAG: hypothetical protein UX70_C0001G0814 [Candidatus Wolfebacteria bacterium GW2011_GWB1_47_1]KKU36181.1 MAG: hypothetical protein UX49_C0021G0005 [Candidatus Wolfebacteria bacterium GW2011_GWC2_46_275]KKU76777.1 MAG: hypothetical protein UY00_C0003G0006 [Candidatus Wolfebacteria bacterium GW2011_GWA1_47_6]